MWGQICPATWVMTAGVKEAPPLGGWSLYPGNVQAGGLTTSLTPVNAQPYGKEAMDHNWLLKLQCIWNVHHDLIYVHIVKESTVDWTDASITSHSRCHHLQSPGSPLILRPCSSYNWEIVPFYPLLPFPPTPVPKQPPFDSLSMKLIFFKLYL